jgi:hypothetical protein
MAKKVRTRIVVEVDTDAPIPDNVLEALEEAMSVQLEMLDDDHGIPWGNATSESSHEEVDA